MALYFNTWFNTWFSWAPVVTQVVNINTDSSYGRTTDPDMAIRSRLNLDVTMALAPGGSTDL